MNKRLIYWLIGGALLGLGIQYLILATLASGQDVDFCPTMMQAWPLFVCLGAGLGVMARAIRLNIKSNRQIDAEETKEDSV